MKSVGGPGAAWCYFGLCAALVLWAASLRLHDLGAHSVLHDEAFTALIARGSLAEVVDNVRHDDVHPILSRLLLRGLQQVDASPFALRLPSAVLGVLTVALLLSLPLAGVRRGAAFLAGILQTFSVEAIHWSQNARLYALSEFVSALMIVSLLLWRRDADGARKGWASKAAGPLLCFSLFLAPLANYGLVLLGGAVLTTALAMNVRQWRRESRNAGLVPLMLSATPPVASFALGLAASFEITLRYHLGALGRVVASFEEDAAHSSAGSGYFQGDYGEALRMLAYGAAQTWDLLAYHLPTALAVAAIPAAALLLFAGRTRGIGALFFLSLAIGALAGLLRVFPFGGMRQCLHLGPPLFLAVGCGLRQFAEGASMALRGGRCERHGAVCAAGVAALFAVGALVAVWHRPARHEPEGMAAMLSALHEAAAPGDVVYVARSAAPSFRFYGYGGAAARHGVRYMFGFHCTFGTVDGCRRELAALPSDGGDYYLAFGRRFLHRSALVPLERAGQIERIGGWRGFERLYKLDAAGLRSLRSLSGRPLSAERWREIDAALRDAAPEAGSPFSVLPHGRSLIYANFACDYAARRRRFFLHVVPVRPADLPPDRKTVGFDNLDFGLGDQPLSVNGDRCVFVVDLPSYAIKEVRTGQFVRQARNRWREIWRIAIDDAALGR